jgi:hypothetical protein
MAKQLKGVTIRIKNETKNDYENIKLLLDDLFLTCWKINNVKAAKDKGFTEFTIKKVAVNWRLVGAL